MDKYTIYCTEEQTKKAIELGAPISFNKVGEGLPSHHLVSREKRGYYEIPTAEQMIGFILETGRGYSCDLTDYIFDLGYKKGCLAFIDFYLK